jgi:hypothetical protein
MKKAYIINFDKGGLLDRFNYNRLHEVLTNDPKVSSWWHYLESSYIVTSQFNVKAEYFAQLFTQLNDDKSVFVCELNLKNCNGLLPNGAWDWIKKEANNTNNMNNNLGSLL